MSLGLYVIAHIYRYHETFWSWKAKTRCKILYDGMFVWKYWILRASNYCFTIQWNILYFPYSKLSRLFKCPCFDKISGNGSFRVLKSKILNVGFTIFLGGHWKIISNNKKWKYVLVYKRAIGEYSMYPCKISYFGGYKMFNFEV